MRSASALPALVLSLLAGCAAVPGLDDPRVEFAPYYAAYRLGGDTSLQSGSGGSVVSNAPIDTSAFALNRRDDDYGGSLSLGDGFSGFDLHYLKLEMKALSATPLPAGWGALDAGDLVRTQVDLDEWRLRYIARVFAHETDNELSARLGLGAALAHRDLDFDAVEINSARRQTLHLEDDGVAYAAARAELGYGAMTLRADYAFSSDWTFGGEWHGDFHDLELAANYLFADQDLAVFAGYRRSELPARGQQSGLDFDADFVLDGFFVGVRFGF